MRGFAGVKTKARGRQHEKEAPAAISGNELHGSGQLEGSNSLNQRNESEGCEK